MSFTVKSIVLDIADNWISPNVMGLRSLEFKLDSTLVDVDTADISATYGTEDGSYIIKNAFNTGLSKTGSQTNCWRSSWGVNSNQRIICVFVSIIEFDEIVINNYHHNGTLTSTGVKNVKLTISTDVITDTTYDAAVSNSTVLYDSTFDEHVASDQIDDQSLAFPISGTTAITWLVPVVEATGTYIGGDVTWLLPIIEATGEIELAGDGDISLPLFIPAATGKCVGGGAAVTFPAFTAEAEGESSGATGDVTFPNIIIHADDDVIIGEISFPALEVTASGSAFGGTGAVGWTAIDADADGLTAIVGELDSFFPFPQALGTGIVSILGTCAITFPALKVATTGLLGRTGNSALQFPVLQLAGTAGGNLSGSPTITMPMLQVYGEGRAEAQTETILRHSRY